VQPEPPLIFTVWPLLLGAVLLTAAILLVMVAPFAALFGFIMSRGLTRRLGALAAAADAWSEGDFSRYPQDKTQDEIGNLGRRMRHMAERIQNLLQAQSELAALQERNRLARELHDTVKQQSFATLMQVRAARNTLAAASTEAPADAARHLEGAEELIKTSQGELGRLISELRPAALEGQGLAAALRSYAGTWAEHSRIPATVQVQNERALPLEAEQALYRVAQEALANVAKHSHASAVALLLSFAPAAVRLVVKDNGVGFDPIQGTTGFGLQSMHQRLMALGGTLLVESGQRGTTVTAGVRA
jgi:NarL family two-component system sensor histidine kinase LiaS